MSKNQCSLAIFGKQPQKQRRDFQKNKSEGLIQRRKIIGLSLFGMAAMSGVSLFQTGIVKHLPDQPVDGFDSDRVNSSDTVYALGVPDVTLSLASLAANIPVAAFGFDESDRRSRRRALIFLSNYRPEKKSEAVTASSARHCRADSA